MGEKIISRRYSRDELYRRGWGDGLKICNRYTGGANQGTARYDSSPYYFIP